MNSSLMSKNSPDPELTFELPVEGHSAFSHHALVRVLQCESGVWFLGLLLFLAMI